MQNAGQQYGQGAASSHPAPSFVQSDIQAFPGTTTSLRQFRKKENVEKQSITETTITNGENSSHVARVAPHNHFPPNRPNDYRCYPQFSEYSVPSQVKYSEIAEIQHPQNHDGNLSPVIQKQKGKEFMDMCNPQQPHMKPPYTDHLGNQHNYSTEHFHSQYLQKEHSQMPQPYKPESQYYSKDHQYQQMQKYNLQSQSRKYQVGENDFLSRLTRINPNMARSIMSDYHLRESQPNYSGIEQNRMYAQNQRYYPTLQSNSYSSNYGMNQHFNYPPSCSRTHQIGVPRYPTMTPHGERSISPRRNYNENMSMPMSYAAMPQKISPNYPQYNVPEYAQHYQHRRMAQDYYNQQHCRPTPYIAGHQIPSELPENRTVTISDNLKQYIESWAEDENVPDINQDNRNLRVREEGSGNETVLMINTSELQYIENGNGIPLVACENGIPLVVDNSTGQLRLIENKENSVEQSGSNERIVNLHIMDSTKTDCMVAANNKNTSPTQAKVVVHSNTVIQAANDIPENLSLDKDDNRKETVDKNCSPINVEQLEELKENSDCSTSSILDENEIKSSESNIDETKLKTEDGDDSTLDVIEELTKECLPQLDLKETNREPDKSMPSLLSDDKKIETEDFDATITENVLSPNNIEDSPKSDDHQNSNDESNKLDIKQEEIVEAEQSHPTDDQDSPQEEQEQEENFNKNSEKIVQLAETNERKSYNKRTKRIFSVDDIIGNIRKGKEPTERRHSLQINREFIEKIKENSELFENINSFDMSTEETIECEETCETKTAVEEEVEELKSKDEELKSKDEELKSKDEDLMSKDEDLKSKDEELKSKDEDLKSKDEESKHDLIPITLENEEIIENTIPEIKDDVLNEEETILTEELEDKIETTNSTNEIQYRSAIRVEDNSVLLEISGELVEINVNIVNGKKIITVTPMSDSAVVDFNDNYENEEELPNLVDNLEEDQSLIKNDVSELEEQMISAEDSVTIPEDEPTIIETDLTDTANEVVVGDEIEEEIDLNLCIPELENTEEKLNLCTKAAKKAYDCDLFIPLVKTDLKNFKLNQPSVHKKKTDSKRKIVKTSKKSLKKIDSKRVKQTEEKREKVEKKITVENNETEKTEEKREKVEKKTITVENETEEIIKNEIITENSDSKDDMNSKIERSPKNVDSETDLNKNQNQTENLETKKTEDDSDEYVDFKELVKARKLKKMKMNASRKIENSKKPNRTISNPQKVKVKPKPIDSDKTSTKKPRKNGNPKCILKKPPEPKETLPEDTKESVNNTIVNFVTDIIQITDANKTEIEQSNSTEKKVTFPENEKIIVEKKASPNSIVKAACDSSSEIIRKEENPKPEGKDSGITFSIADILQDNQQKKKLSLEEYNKRKRKHSTSESDKDLNLLPDKSNIDKETVKKHCNNEDKILEKSEVVLEECPKEDEIFKTPRSKSLDDLSFLIENENYNNKRKLSLETTSKELFDWDETQSPKQLTQNVNEEESITADDLIIPNLTSNKPKCFININELNPIPTESLSQSSEDEMLQIYKEQVHSKLNSLNIQIPKVKPPPTVTFNNYNPYISNESQILMKKFLNNEKITPEEMEKIKKIISYKRIMQQWKEIQESDNSDFTQSPLTNSNYEIHKECESDRQDIKLHLKKVPEYRRKTKKRFRNLYTDSEDSDSDNSFVKNSNSGDYSVVQSNSFATGVPKLIIKRRTDMPQPIVRLERLDMDIVAKRKKPF